MGFSSKKYPISKIGKKRPKKGYFFDFEGLGQGSNVDGFHFFWISPSYTIIWNWYIKSFKEFITLPHPLGRGGGEIKNLKPEFSTLFNRTTLKKSGISDAWSLLPARVTLMKLHWINLRHYVINTFIWLNLLIKRSKSVEKRFYSFSRLPVGR